MSLLDNLPARVGFLGTAMLLFNAAHLVATAGDTPVHPVNVVWSAAGWLLAIMLIVFALKRAIPRRAAPLILVGCIFFVLTNAYVADLSRTPTSFSTDNGKIAEYSAHVLESGVNPYNWDYTDAFHVYRNTWGTFWVDNAFQYRLTYPALPTLLLAVLDAFGLGNVTVLILIFHILLLCLIFFNTPHHLRPVVLLPLFLLKDFSLNIVIGVQDIVTSALIVAMLIAWRRRVLRAVLFGLACAFRQQPWFIAPFLLITMWYDEGTSRERLGRIGTFVGISVGVFMLINLPFIIQDPRGFLLGAFEPSYARFDVFGVGLNLLWEVNIARLSREFFTVLQISTYAALLTIHWRHPCRVGNAFWLFPGLFFWVYYRSLPNYWVYWIPPLLFVVARSLEGGIFQPAQINVKPYRARTTLLLLAPLALLNVAHGAYLLSRPPEIQLSYQLPLRTFYWADPLVSQMAVSVTNESDSVLTPRFSLKRDSAESPAPWSIYSGPEQLRPGQTGAYVIGANDVNSRMIYASRGGQLVLNDAGGNYRLRTVIDIAGDPSFTNPDLIENPGFRFWRQDANTPLKWALSAEGGADASVSMGALDGRDALAVSVNTPGDAPYLIRLSQTISFPGSFAVWVHPGRTSGDSASAVYGLEFDDGTRRLRVLFGERDGVEAGDPAHATVYQRAPAGEWSQQIVDIGALYGALGWPLPDYSLRNRSGPEFDARQVQVSLIAGGVDGAYTAFFGGFEQSGDFALPERLVADAIAHPDTYYTNVADEYRRQRNFTLAIEAYQRATVYNPANASAYFGLGESYFWMQDYQAAADAFVEATRLGYQPGGLAYKGLGHSLYNLGYYDQAARAFEQSIAGLGENRAANAVHLADAYIGLGRVQVALGDCAAARRLFQEAETLSPDAIIAQNASLGVQECAAKNSALG